MSPATTTSVQTVFDQVIVTERGFDKSFSRYLVIVNKTHIYIGPKANFAVKWKEVESMTFSRHGEWRLQRSPGEIIECRGPGQSAWPTFSEFVQKRWSKLCGKQEPEQAAKQTALLSNKKPKAARKPRQTYGSKRRPGGYGSSLRTATNTDFEQFSSDDEAMEGKKQPASKKGGIQFDDIEDDHHHHHRHDEHQDDNDDTDEEIFSSTEKKRTTRKKIIDDDDDDSDLDTILDDPEDGGLTTPVPDQRAIVTPRFSSTQHSIDQKAKKEPKKDSNEKITAFFASKKPRSPAPKSPVHSPLRTAPTHPSTPPPRTPKQTPMDRLQNSSWIDKKAPHAARRRPYDDVEDVCSLRHDRSHSRKQLTYSSSLRYDEDDDHGSHNMSTAARKRRNMAGRNKSGDPFAFMEQFKARSTQDAADHALSTATSPRHRQSHYYSSPSRAHQDIVYHHRPQGRRRPIDLGGSDLAYECPWRGLRNLGNTCYCNASLQMLMSVPDFVNGLESCKTKGDLGKRLSAVFAELNLVNEGQAVNPRDFKKAVDKVTDRFLGYEQRDAHEFLSDLIDRVHDEIVDVKKKETERAQKEEKKPAAASQEGLKENSPNASQEVEATEAKDRSVDVETLPTDSFRLDVEVCLQCDSCGYSRTMKEMYRHLSLDMNDEEKEEQTLDEWTMEKGLAKFFSPEKRELKCEKCSDGRTATQTLRVISCPKFLLLHLKRFTVVEKPRSLTPPPDAVDDKENAEGSSPKKQAAIEMTFHKNKSPVEIHKTLSLDSFVSSETKEDESVPITSPTYKLVSVAKHIGSSAFSGHYTADGLRRPTPVAPADSNKEWFAFDDGRTEPTTEDKVLNNGRNKKNAYMLLYSAE